MYKFKLNTPLQTTEHALYGKHFVASHGEFNPHKAIKGLLGRL